MKKYLIIIVCIVGLFSFTIIEKEVYICVSSTAKAYHLNENCKGLSRCTHKISKVTLKDAVYKYKRKLCGWED